MDPLLQSNGKKPRRGEVLQCPRCSRSFYVSPAQVGRRTYCSRACKEAVQTHRAALTCRTCGKEFERPQSRGGHFCSWPCYQAHRPARPNCGVCGGVLPLLRRRYCSLACTHLARKRGTEKPCEVCGTAMYVEPHLAERKRFCSKECTNRAKEIDGPGFVHQRADGYLEVYYPKHPDATKSGRILQHRLVAEQKYGRRILPTEHVHHRDGDRANNDPANLEVINPSDHARESNQRGVKKRKTAAEELAEYRKRFGPLK